MPFLRTVSFMVFLSIFLTGCTKGCSGTQSDTTAGSAMQPASKPTASFRIVPSGVECVAGQTCRDSDILLLGDLSRDLAQPIDWTRETVDWQVNHDFAANLKKAQEENKLSVSCDTAQIKSLYRTRQKLFYILRKLTVEDERWRDRGWFHNRSYYEFLIFHDAARLGRLSGVLNSVRADIGIADQGLASDWRLFASELLRYRTMVLSVPDWEKRFDELVKSERNLVSGAPFHDAGFPKTDDACHHLPWIFGGNYIVGYDQGLEGWFYSFWVRRHKEGAMDVVKDLLEWGVAAVPAAQNNTVDFTWSKSAPGVANEQH